MPRSSLGSIYRPLPVVPPLPLGRRNVRAWTFGLRACAILLLVGGVAWAIVDAERTRAYYEFAHRTAEPAFWLVFPTWVACVTAALVLGSRLIRGTRRNRLLPFAVGLLPVACGSVATIVQSRELFYTCSEEWFAHTAGCCIDGVYSAARRTSWIEADLPRSVIAATWGSAAMASVECLVAVALTFELLVLDRSNLGSQRWTFSSPTLIGLAGVPALGLRAALGGSSTAIDGAIVIVLILAAVLAALSVRALVPLRDSANHDEHRAGFGAAMLSGASSIAAVFALHLTAALKLVQAHPAAVVLSEGRYLAVWGRYALDHGAAIGHERGVLVLADTLAVGSCLIVVGATCSRKRPARVDQT